MDVVLRDRDLCDLYVRDAWERQSAHGNLRAIAAALEQLIEKKPITACLLPEGCLIRPLALGETRVRLRDGRVVIAMSGSGTTRLALPDDLDLGVLVFVNHTVDRGSVGASMLHYGQSVGLLWTVEFGWYHDLWNSIRNTAKVCLGGRLWRSVLRFSKICNMNHGPFRSAAWGKAKQSALKRWMDSHTPQCDAFRALAPKLGESYNLPYDTDADLERLWAKMGCLPSCCEAGPILKLSRWCSVSSCWDWYKKELWGLREVLKSMSPQSLETEKSDSTSCVVFQETKSAVDDNNQRTLTTVPHFICQNLIDDMNIFCLATSVQQQCYSDRATNVKNATVGFTHTLWLMKGGWEHEFLDTIKTSFHDVNALDSLGVWLQDTRPETKVAMLANFTLEMLEQRLWRILPSMYQYPQRAALCLDPFSWTLALELVGSPWPNSMRCCNWNLLP